MSPRHRSGRATMYSARKRRSLAAHRESGSRGASGSPVAHAAAKACRRGVPRGRARLQPSKRAAVRSRNPQSPSPP
eukprot:10139862-Alexandrium_andersonii.AAC.1